VRVRLPFFLADKIDNLRGQKNTSEFLREVIQNYAAGENGNEKYEKEVSFFLEKLEAIEAKTDFIMSQIQEVEKVKEALNRIADILEKSGLGISENEKKAIAEILYLTAPYGSGNWKALSHESQKFLLKNTGKK